MYRRTGRLMSEWLIIQMRKALLPTRFTPRHSVLSLCLRTAFPYVRGVRGETWGAGKRILRCRGVFRAFAGAFLLLMTSNLSLWGSKPAQFLSVPEMVVIKASARTPPPEWAILERHLMKTIDQAAPLYLKAFTFRGGTLRKGGKIDDDYESFGTWPLYYVLGGDEKILDWAVQEWNAITRQWAYERDSVYKEFVKHYDMLHLTEGYVGFQYFGLADPTIPENVARARRFAGFYLNEDPEAQNYDPQHKIIRSPLTGSQGPSYHSDSQYTLNYGHASLYPLVKELEPDWDKDLKRREEIQKLYDQVVLHGDVPMNMAVTGLVANAFFYTGEEKYRHWILEYVDAWLDRIRKNNGVIPDNVGLQGKIGEYRQGQWWGGFFGWSGRYSVEMIFNALITAAECAQLVSGDSRYLQLLRSQVDVLLNQSIIQDGNLLVPYKYGPKGWEDFRPLEPYILSHLWHASMDPRDWERLEKLRAGSKTGPLPYARATSPNPPAPGSEMWHSDGTPVDWNQVFANIEQRNQDRDNEPAHLRYLAGENADWPEKILRAEYQRVSQSVERLRSGTFEHLWKSQTVTEQNPVFTNGLAQVTLGAPHTCFNGGLLRARVRYFDLERERPGLPEDVAALVEKVEADRTVLQLVNLSAFHTRRLIVQAGAFGEHQFTEITLRDSLSEKASEGDTSEKRISVQKKFFAVELSPDAGITLEIGTRCFANRPSYAFPFHPNNKEPRK